MDAKQDNCKPKVFYDPMSMNWSEKYSDKIDVVWGKLPDFLRGTLAAIAVFLLGVSFNGEWINITVHLSKQLGYFKAKNFFLTDFKYFWLSSIAVSYSMFILIGGFLHWYFYVRQRDTPEKWKCQPHKFLSPELERHEILMGSFTLFVNCTVSSLIACYVANGGWSMTYYNINDYPLWWFVLQIPAIFIYQDYSTYLLHRLYHRPFLYKHFHKLHHKYKQPTAFSVTAIHPVESVHLELNYALPLFIIPCHWATFYAVCLYVYYNGIINHSGIDFKASWWQPWQPDTMFHDNHHQYFHVNYGFNCEIWDKIHGTYRRKDMIYNEDNFDGKPICEATEEELKNELEERMSENPAAHRGENYLLMKEELVMNLKDKSE
ncbi:delta(7)-sterol 5(6)-desaturase erg31-like [Agrilus planipennis]|uniref:Delta(7)-sterol 5(6)-desaturase erg31-like n=1 Tax=Agrilus planipennis TaxID=224129 RepID=A0A1W4WN39_AGRPL|nr:delta(7)-sterol 5(6)-desaturase erg31-like [Agrilus planipennis]